MNDCKHEFECNWEIDQSAEMVVIDWYERCPVCGDYIGKEAE